jgi:hypothetical protein
MFYSWFTSRLGSGVAGSKIFNIWRPSYRPGEGRLDRKVWVYLAIYRWTNVRSDLEQKLRIVRYSMNPNGGLTDSRSAGHSWSTAARSAGAKTFSGLKL